MLRLSKHGPTTQRYRTPILREPQDDTLAVQDDTLAVQDDTLAVQDDTLAVQDDREGVPLTWGAARAEQPGQRPVIVSEASTSS